MGEVFREASLLRSHARSHGDQQREYRIASLKEEDKYRSATCNLCLFQQNLPFLPFPLSSRRASLIIMPYREQCPRCPRQFTRSAAFQRHKKSCQKRLFPNYSQRPPATPEGDVSQLSILHQPVANFHSPDGNEGPDPAPANVDEFLDDCVGLVSEEGGGSSAGSAAKEEEDHMRSSDEDLQWGEDEMAALETDGADEGAKEREGGGERLAVAEEEERSVIKFLVSSNGGQGLLRSDAGMLIKMLPKECGFKRKWGVASAFWKNFDARKRALWRLLELGRLGLRLSLIRMLRMPKQW